MASCGVGRCSFCDPGLAGVPAFVAFQKIFLHFVPWPLLCDANQSFHLQKLVVRICRSLHLPDMLGHFLPEQQADSDIQFVPCHL